MCTNKKKSGLFLLLFVQTELPAASYTPNAHIFQGWTKPKLGAENTTQISPVGGISAAS